MNLDFDNIHYLQKLTFQERQVFYLRIEGHTCKEIADALFVEECTAKKHLENIHRKLGVSSQAELILLIHEKGGN